jgi:hypothetical protein
MMAIMEIVMQQPGFTNIFATLVTMHTLGRLRQDTAIEEAWAINESAEALEAENDERLANLIALRRQRRAGSRSST